VYRAKLLDLHDFLIKNGHFGKVAAWAHVTEFQKRGLPHEHFLLIMDKSAKLSGHDDFDNYISAELPDEKYPELHRLVCKHMIHRPCGVLNKNCGCMVDGVCRFKYPRQFCEGLNKRKTHILYIEEGRMDKRFLLGKNGWIIDGLFHITLPY